jgi:predicted amidophosphoribosyltransferase
VCQAPLDPADTRCDACGTSFNLFCPRCDAELAPDSEFCSACGLAFSEEAEADAEGVQAAMVEEDTRTCPSCGELIFLPDGFCRECGQELCPSCGETIAEEDDTCAHCGLTLYFPCPLCDFELMAGTEICPNCQALFPNFCTVCGQPVDLKVAHCEACGAAVSRDPRPGARVVQVVVIEERRTPILACPRCDEHFSPVVSDCPRCGTRVCPRCQVTLEEQENVCPRCGLAPEATRERPPATARCPVCKQEVPAGSDECPHCQQALCPQCLAAIDEDDLICTQCGVEFEYSCPECGKSVGPEQMQCPHCGVAFLDDDSGHVPG